MTYLSWVSTRQAFPGRSRAVSVSRPSRTEGPRLHGVSGSSTSDHKRNLREVVSVENQYHGESDDPNRYQDQSLP